MPSRPASRRAREIVRAKRAICWWCGRPIIETPDVHHLNEDHDDDRDENIVPVHHGCHTQIHRPWNGEAVAESNRRRKGTYTTKCKRGCTCRRHRRR
jgi:hypothetical protein